MRTERAGRAGALLCGALSLALPATAAAQTIGDDVRCMLLGNGYARLAKDENTRRAAAMTGAFFLGRLSGHLGDSALAAAIRAQGTGLPGKEAEPLMRACAVRAAAANTAMATALRGAAKLR